MGQARPAGHGVSLREAFFVWMRIAALSFGGPAGQIAVMHRILVEEKRWIGDGRFLNALNYCMLLPGPEAQQLAIYIGWLMHRTLGGVIAGTLFVLPGVVTIMALSWLYAGMGDVGLVQAVFFGLKAAVLAIVLQALLRLGRRALRNGTMVAVAVTAFIAIFLFGVPFPLIVLGAGLIGLGGAAVGAAAFSGGTGHGSLSGVADADSRLGATLPAHARPTLAWSIKLSTVLLILWLGPIAAIWVFLGPEDVFTRIAVFFAQMAVVTFGGAYAVLAYVAQQAVETYGWLNPAEMLDGLGMAETTPGPLIMVVQFVGFMGGFRGADALNPLVAGTLAGLLTTWVTFVPCFLWIFLGAPFIETLRGSRLLSGGLSAITAAVVGVILNLAVWFAIHVLFARVSTMDFGPMRLNVPDLSTLNVAALILTAGAVVATLRFKVGMIAVIVACAVLGVLYRLLLPGS